MTGNGNHILKNLAAVVVVFAVVFGLSARVEAADVEWAPGFPKLSEGKVLLMWNAVKDANSYKVYRRRGASGDFVLLTSGKVNRYIDDKAEPGYEYFYNVVAMKGEEQLAKSENKGVKLEAEKKFVAMTVPKLVGVVEKTEVDGSPSAGVRWEMAARPSDLAAYNVYRSSSKGGPYTLIGTSQILDFTDTDVERGKKYYYTVTAVDTNFKETQYSNEVAIDVKVLDLPEPVKKAPTRMMRAKHLFDIKSYVEGTKPDKDGKPQPVIKPLVFPVDISVDEAVGHIYIAANDYGGVLVYNMDGKFQFGMRAEGVGSNKKIKGVHGVDVGPGGKIYVASYNNNNIYIYELSGKLDNIIEVDIKKILGKTPEGGKISTHFDVAVNSVGDIYTTDIKFNRIHAFDYKGRHKFDVDGLTKKAGSEDVLFNGPGFCYIDGADNFLTLNTANGSLIAFDADGKFRGVVVEGARSMGEAEKLFHPTGICVDDKGRIFVANGLDPNVQAFDIDGNFLFAVSNEDMNGPIKSQNMRGIYVDNSGRLYVTEVLSDTVAVYQLSGEVEEVVAGAVKK